MATPNSPWKNNPVTRGWADGPQLIKIIIYVNIAMYLVSLVISKGVFSSGFSPFQFLSPSGRSLAVLGATGTLLVNDVGWWTLISANYLHGNILHIFFNMAAVNQIAPLITQLYGPHRFFIIFTVSGAGGFLVSYLMGIPITVGASAALCGLIGAAIYYGKDRGGFFGQAIYKQIGGWAVAIIIFGFLIPQINNSAHIGGMVVGALCAAVLGYNEKSREGRHHRWLAAACIVLTILVLLRALLRAFITILV
jgi:rhomboid protease GluP